MVGYSPLVFQRRARGVPVSDRDRRLAIGACVLAVAVSSQSTLAQPTVDHLTIVAPAAPGGGWDQTARAMQHVLTLHGIVRNVQVENVPGAAGTIGLAQFISTRRGEPDTLLVTGLVMVGAIVFNQSPVSLASVTPIARLTGEYEVIAVPARSPIQSVSDILERMRARPDSVAWGGGSAGGTDHILAGLIAAAAGADPRRVNYIAFSGGGEAVAALLGDQVTAGVSGYSEFAPHIASGRLRALAISAPDRVAAIPVQTLRAQGIDVDLANWRAVVAPPAIGAAARQQLIDVIDRMVQTATWRETLVKREWTDQFLPGDSFAKFLDAERARVTRIAARLRAGSSSTVVAAPGSRVFPTLVFVVAILVLARLVQTFREDKKTRTRSEPAAVQSTNWQAVLRIATGLALFAALLVPAGFIVASAALFVGTAYAFGSRRFLRDAAVAVLFSAIVYVAFTRGLDLTLPAGVWARWRP